MTNAPELSNWSGGMGTEESGINARSSANPPQGRQPRTMLTMSQTQQRGMLDGEKGR
jgi:hypothetical protein